MNAPRRIVSLISSATEILFLIGAGRRVVGVSHECDFPSEVAVLPRLTRSLVDAAAASRAIDEQVGALASNQSTLYAIDVERVIELAPDLIITQAQCDVCAVRYEDVVSAVRGAPSLAHAQIVALNPRSLADLFDDVARIAAAVGDPASGQRALAGLHERVADVQAKTKSLAPSRIPRVACLEWIDPPMLAANWTPELVEMAGGEAGLAAPGEHSTYANWDAIVRYDPQVVVIMPCGFDLDRAIEESQVLPRTPGWSQLSAVREGCVFAADGNAYFNRSGPRLVDSLEILAHLFHPELFALEPHLGERAWRRLETRRDALVPAAAK